MKTYDYIAIGGGSAGLVHSPDAKTNFRNLLSGAIARGWMEEAARRLRMRMPMPLGALAQDGGLGVNDLTANMPEQDRMALAKEFFLS